MLRHQTMDSETGNTVSMAIIKIMLRALTSLGFVYTTIDYKIFTHITSYSVRFGLFNSVNYGIPQDRTRLLLYGVKAGHPMPRIPLTSHVTLKKPTTWFTRFIRYPTCLPSEEGFSAGTTLAAAIGDLPPFDWYVKPCDIVQGVLSPTIGRHMGLAFLHETRETYLLFQANLQVQRDMQAI